MDGWLARARAAAGLTEEECAKLLRVDESRYRELEARPGGMTVLQLAAFCRGTNDEARAVVRSFLLPMTRKEKRGLN